MARARRVLVSLFALGQFACGCGGTTSSRADAGSGGFDAGAGGANGGSGGTSDAGRAGGGSGGTGADGGSGGDDAATSVSVPGAYELVIDTVTRTDSTHGGPVAPNGVTSPSEKQRMRFDVRASQTGGIESLVTARWGMPGRMDGSASSGTYRLSGEVLVSGFTGANVGDHWTTLLVAGSGDGLATSVTMKGVEDVVQGDVVWMYDLEATATLQKDRTPPELRSNPASKRGPADALLPWDPIEVQLAEPVDRAELESKIVVSSDRSDVDSGSAPSEPVVWQSTPTDAALGWAGIVRSLARFTRWDASPAQTTSAHEVRLTKSVADPSGLLSKTFLMPFTVLEVGGPVPEFGFDTTDAQRPASWGAVTFAGAASGHCEKGGCLEIGPYNAPYCGTTRSGVAGRVQAPTGTLDVRYRLLYPSDATSPDQPAKAFGGAFVVEVVHAGADVTTQVVNAAPATSLIDLGSAAGELRWASPWTTLSVALPGPTPPSVVDLGFSVGSGDAVSTACGGGPLPPSVKTLLVVDSISGR